MGFRTIEDDIKSGAINKAAPVLLCGEEYFLIDNYERKLRSLFSGKLNNDEEDVASAVLPDLDVSVFYGNEATDEAIIGALETFPMLSPNRVVIVKGHPDLSSKSASGTSDSEAKGKRKNGLADYMEMIPDTARLVFTSDKVNKTRALYKAIVKFGTAYDFTRLDEADLLRFVRKRVNMMGAAAEPEVLDALIFASGYLEKDSDRDLFTVQNDVYKVASFALSEGRDKITLSDVEECLPGTLRTDVFAMLDAISSGKKAAAIQLLENSLASGENVFRLLSLITGHFEIMLGYKELAAKGCSTAEITRILGERSDWRVKRLGGFARRFDEEKLKQTLLNLYETERRIKSGDISERLAITVLFAEVN